MRTPRGGTKADGERTNCITALAGGDRERRLAKRPGRQPGRTEEALAGDLESNALVGVEATQDSPPPDMGGEPENVSGHDPRKDAGEEPGSEPGGLGRWG